MENKELEIKINEHQYKITSLETILDRLTKNLEELQKVTQQQELLLQKISQTNESFTDTIKGMHNRIDDCEDCCEHLDKKVNEFKDNIKEYIENEKRFFLSELQNRPCVTHHQVEKEMALIKDKVDRHAKIFWWIQSVMGGGLLLAIVKGVLK